MAEVYPCSLPGVLVNSNSYTRQSTVRKNNLQSGPPVYRLESDDGWVMFDVSWSFNAAQMQLFNSWKRYTLRQCSKSFVIKLMIDGAAIDHTCYFDVQPSIVQAGKRWSVSATLLSIQEEGINACSGESLITVAGYGDPASIVSGMQTATETIEALWLP